MLRGPGIIASALLAMATLAGCDSTSEVASDGALVAAEMPPLEFEALGRSESLAGLYEDDWFFAHDLNFNTLGRGKIMVIDAGDGAMNYRGAIDADQFASFLQSSSRKELYVAETFYSRGSRGTRTDVVTIYDRDTLMVESEVVLPNNNRAQNVTQKAALSITDNSKFALVYTFTPATGVAVIDLDSRTLVNEIDTAGCILAYPSGAQGFASLCGDGRMVNFTLDNAGRVAARAESQSFNDIDNNPMFMMSARVGDITYFPTFEGSLQGVRLGDGAPAPLPIWNFAEGTDREPSGWQVISADDAGQVYVLMRADSKPGDHKFGGGEIWVLDPVERTIVRKITLAEESLSIEVSHGPAPKLLVTSLTMGLDVYDLEQDARVRTVSGFLSSNPFVLHAVER